MNNQTRFSKPIDQNKRGKYVIESFKKTKEEINFLVQELEKKQASVFLP